MPDDIIFRKAKFGGFNRDDVMSYIGAIKQNEETLILSNTEKDKIISELSEKINELNELLAKKDEERIDEINCLTNKFNSELTEIKAEYEEKVTKNIEADRAVQEKVGSAMIDVRRYADLLLNETCDKINNMSEKSDAATAKTLSRVLDISAGIQMFSDKLNSVIADILDENEKICKDLTDFKGSLRIPFEKANGKMISDIIEG